MTTQTPSTMTDAPRVEIPKTAAQAAQAYPSLWQAYQALGEEAGHAGPLDPRARRLVHLAYALGQGSEGAVHSHVRRGLSEGISPAEFEHVALLAVTTLGWPQAMRALTLVHDVTSSAGEEGDEAESSLLNCFGY